MRRLRASIKFKTYFSASSNMLYFSFYSSNHRNFSPTVDALINLGHPLEYCYVTIMKIKARKKMTRFDLTFLITIPLR